MRTALLVSVAAALVTVACASFNTAQQESLSDARHLSAAAVKDPLFRSILRELEDSAALVWDVGRRNALRGRGRERPTEWVLEHFDSLGLFSEAAVRPWRKWWNPWSATIASAYPGSDSMRLNVNNFNYNPFGLANTLVHERTHSFCVLHPYSQSNHDNYCDPGYVIGDLAEALARFRATGKREASSDSLCPGLCRALVRRGILTSCKEAQRKTLVEPRAAATDTLSCRDPDPPAW